VAAIEATFNADFNDTTITAPTGDNLVWSPTQHRSATARALHPTAQTTKLSVISQRSDDTVIRVQPVEAAIKRGVAVTLSKRISTAPTPQSSTPLKAAGAQIAIFSSKTGYTSTPKPYWPTTAQRRQTVLWAFGKLLHRFA